ncbi:MAG: PKD domain-containing protein [Cryomorphaceae bacterium]|nr:PKD domain-containing protein [Cryomorphaceae bacterium]
MKRIINTLQILSLLFGFSIAASSQVMLFPVTPENGIPESQNLDFSDNNYLPDLGSQPSAVVADNVAHTTMSGDWFDPSIWDCGCIPFGSYDIFIESGHSVTLGFNNQIVNLSIANGATLSCSEDISYMIIVNGDWDNHGEFNAGKSLVSFVGSELQQISGLSTFYDINFQGNHTIEILGNVNVESKMYLSDATVITNDRLILASKGINDTASLAPVLSGSIVGKIGVERDVNAAYNGWITLGSPYLDAIVEDWDDDFITTGFIGSDYPSYSFVSIQSYDESASNGTGDFIPVSNSNETLLPGKGYYVYVLAGNHSYDLLSTPILGEFEFPVTNTVSGNTQNDGLNLLGNPYLSDLNWDSASGWTKLGVSGAVYVWDIALNHFRTYSNGYGVNGGTPIIRNGEAFWVQSYQSDLTLKCNELSKLSGPTTPVNVGNEFLQLRMDGLGLGDEMLLAITEGTTNGFDPSNDAYKFFSANAKLNLATVCDDGTFLAINNIPMPETEVVVPIMLTAAQAGTVTAAIEHAPELNGACMWIKDVVTGDVYGIHDTSTFTFETEIVTEQIRFEIHIDRVSPNISTNIACNGDASGSIFASTNGDGIYNFVLTDVDGATVLATEGNEATAENLTPGIYTLVVDAFAGCPTMTETIEITEPTPLFMTSAHQDLACNEDLTGWITIEYGGGIEPYNVLWSDGSVGDSLENIGGGTYNCILTDANGCEHAHSIEVFEEPEVFSAFTPSATNVTIANDNGLVSFQNNSSGAFMYSWNFGDGVVSTEENPTHMYAEPGMYFVNLFAYNEHCLDISEVVIVVEEGVSVANLGELQNVQFVNHGNTPIVIFPDELKGTVRIDVYNLAGQMIAAPIQGQFSKQSVPLNLRSNVTAAIITVTNLKTNNFVSFRYIRQ